jgi:YoeB-like toxin of bacterial type II toxin-antitoxin system
MNLIFAPQAWADYLYWQTTDPKMLRRVNELIRDTSRSPFECVAGILVAPNFGRTSNGLSRNRIWARDCAIAISLRILSSKTGEADALLMLLFLIVNPQEPA